eukprot:1502717-Rhodomonas_salina.1
MRKVNEEEEETRKVNKEQGPDARGESRERDKNEMKQRGGRGGEGRGAPAIARSWCVTPIHSVQPVTETD